MRKKTPEDIEPTELVRPLIQRLTAYVPGEQPKAKGLVKLNTNENAYGPSPKVLAALKDALDDRLRLYPNPTADPVRERLAKHHGCTPENLVVGNGSDELLALAVRVFVDSSPGGAMDHYNVYPSHGAAKVSLRTVQYFVPSYSLYPVLADLHGAHRNPVPLPMEFELPSQAALRRGRAWDVGAALTCITTPNAPTGRGYTTADLETLIKAQERVVLLDEAYADFAEESALELALRYPHVLVLRTFSKAYSLCSLRIGYAVGHPSLIAGLQKAKDSYNVNGLAQIGALATLDDLPYYRANIERVKKSRESLAAALTELGFTVLPSQTNFLFVRPPRFPAELWLEKLREKNVLVRWFDTLETRPFLRITVGKEAEIKALLDAAKKILAAKSGAE
jgi:histidinol-phosphate aminotransferase